MFDRDENGEMPQQARKHVLCKDGFKMSVQASSNHYCSPKSDGYDMIYSEVEVGFPSEREPLLDKYVEDLSGEDGVLDYTDSVYPYVPAEIVSTIIAKHGGIVGGRCPQLGYIFRIPIYNGVTKKPHLF